VVDLRAQLERWNGAVFASRDSRILSNRLASLRRCCKPPMAAMAARPKRW